MDQLIAVVDRLEREMCQAFLRDGSVAAMGTVVDDAGNIVDVVPDLGGDFAGALRASCGRRRAAAVWIVGEAWSARERGEGPWAGLSPADRPDRREVLMSQLESVGFARTRLWPIVRDGDRVRLGEVEELRTAAGRLSGMFQHSQAEGGGHAALRARPGRVSGHAR